jgi:hypothetical protein
MVYEYLRGNFKQCVPSFDKNWQSHLPRINTRTGGYPGNHRRLLIGCIKSSFSLPFLAAQSGSRERCKCSMMQGLVLPTVLPSNVYKTWARFTALGTAGADDQAGALSFAVLRVFFARYHFGLRYTHTRMEGTGAVLRWPIRFLPDRPDNQRRPRQPLRLIHHAMASAIALPAADFVICGGGTYTIFTPVLHLNTK